MYRLLRNFEMDPNDCLYPFEIEYESSNKTHKGKGGGKKLLR